MSKIEKIEQNIQALSPAELMSLVE